MGLLGASGPSSEELLDQFAVVHGLVPAAEVDEVDDLLPRSCQVVDAHQLHSRWSDFAVRWHAYRGMLPGGVEGVIAHVEISGDEIYSDVFDIVRLPAPTDVVLPTVEIQGPLRGALKAVGGHRTADVPFRMGKARKVNLPGVHRRHKARVARTDDPAAIEAVFNPGFVGWLAATNPPFCFELFAGWMTVFRLEHRPEPEEGLYPALGDAATRFAGACRGLPGAH